MTCPKCEERKRMNRESARRRRKVQYEDLNAKRRARYAANPEPYRQAMREYRKRKRGVSDADND